MPAMAMNGADRNAAVSSGGRRAPENMKAKEFEREEDATAALDFGAARRPAPEQRRVNVDFPTWMIDALDKEAARLGVTRQSVIKTWIADRLERRRPPAGAGLPSDR